jgi:hypothetical protein
MQAFERGLGRLAGDVDRAMKARMTAEQAERGQQIAREMFEAKLGGDTRFSGWAPAFETQTKPIRDGATLLTPTKSGAGVATVAFIGRNKGNGGGMAGPGVMRSGRTSARVKSGGRVRVRKTKRWNGYTDSKVDPDAVREAIEKAARDIADKHARTTTQRHFDVT